VRARLWWSLWTEPGDREVGEFIERVGAAEAARVAHRVLRRGLRQIAKNFSEDLSLLRRLASARRPPPTREQVTEALERCEREKIRLTTPQDGEWPSALNDLGPYRPLLIFSRGQVEHLRTTQMLIAVVGTRRPSVSGARAASLVSDSLVNQGITIVSGGALGIDAIAHRSALAAQRPTIVVGATSLDRHYPREHAALFEHAAREGVVVSETPPGKAISPRSFLARNRLIAAISSAVIVVECPARSGAISTASHAATLGRELFALSYDHPRPENEGAQRLIEEWNATVISVPRDGHNSGVRFPPLPQAV